MKASERPLRVIPNDDLTRDTSGRQLKSHSFLSALTAVGENVANILDGKSLRLNEMTGIIEFGGVALDDTDISHVRGEMERRITVGVSKDGEPQGLQISKEDVLSAIVTVAKKNAYHPVAQYLGGLHWDGTARVENVVGSILKCDVTGEANLLNKAIVRRFFIAAVARALKPGAKVDTVFIIVGAQGIGKSTFFDAIANPFFLDTAIDISKKDALEQLRHAWIIEWAELESLFRARDASMVKAFLSSRRDTYRASYARTPTTVPRSCVIVGTSNADEFLTDETGNRRMWPVKVSAVNVEEARGQRDQLWAEAVQLYRNGEQWWLTVEEELSLDKIHDDHRVQDVWEERVLSWAKSQTCTFSTGDVLIKAIEKDAAASGRADEMRVAKILKTAGWFKKTDPQNKTKSKRWYPPKEKKQ